MILKRLFKSVADQNWLAVLLEIVVVVVGIFLGIQATNWSEERKSIAEGYYYLDLLQRQLDAQIQVIEDDIAGFDDRIDKIRSARELLYATRWSEDEYAQFKSNHVAVYQGARYQRRPSALRVLLDSGKIELVESRALQEMIFSLDSAYANSILQTETYTTFKNETTSVLTRAIPYGTRDDLMAIPVDPGILLESEELKWSIRLILIMDMIERTSLKRLLGACSQAQDELKTYLSSDASRFPREAD